MTIEKQLADALRDLLTEATMKWAAADFAKFSATCDKATAALAAYDARPVADEGEVERVARAILDVRVRGFNAGWDDSGGRSVIGYGREMARAAIAAMSPADRLTQLEGENARLKAQEQAMVDALHDVSIGGNHAALLIGADHPLYTVSYEDAETHYGSNLDGLNAWFCWRAIMKATREVYDTLPESVRNEAWKRMEQRRARAALNDKGSDNG